MVKSSAVVGGIGSKIDKKIISDSNANILCQGEANLEQRTSLVSYLNAIDHYSPIIKKIALEQTDTDLVPKVIDSISTQSINYARKIAKNMGLESCVKTDNFILMLSNYYLTNIVDWKLSIEEIIANDNATYYEDIVSMFNKFIVDNLLGSDFFNIKFTNGINRQDIYLSISKRVPKVVQMLSAYSGIEKKDDSENKKLVAQSCDIFLKRAYALINRGLNHYIRKLNGGVTEDIFFKMFDEMLSMYILFFEDNLKYAKGNDLSPVYTETDRLVEITVRVITISI